MTGGFIQVNILVASFFISHYVFEIKNCELFFANVILYKSVGYIYLILR